VSESLELAAAGALGHLPFEMLAWACGNGRTDRFGEDMVDVTNAGSESFGRIALRCP
jgi:hypothetical protein